MLHFTQHLHMSSNKELEAFIVMNCSILAKLMLIVK